MSRYRTVSVSFISGKGGVGKSNLALNISYSLHILGNAILLMDCDMGLANMDVLLGVTPSRHVQNILTGDASASEVLIPVTNADDRPFDLLPANSGLAEYAELGAGARTLLVDRINPIASRYDFLCLDAGAGISSMVLGFSAMTAVRLMVISPEPTSMTDSYAMMKVLNAKHGTKDFSIIVNQVESEEEGKATFTRLATVCRRFLGFTPSYLGAVHYDKALHEAVRRQKPLLQISPQSLAAKDCMEIAVSLQRMRDTLVLQAGLGEPLKPEPGNSIGQNHSLA